MRAYRDIEASVKLPASCPLFLEAIAECFSLHDEEVELLTLLLARDILRETLGHEVTDALLGDGPDDDGVNSALRLARDGFHGAPARVKRGRAGTTVCQTPLSG